MTTENKNGYVIIKADDGKFLANKDMTLYGFEIILGIYDSPDNYNELPVEQFPVIQEPDEPIIEPGDEPFVEPDSGENNSNEHVENPLETARASKLRDIRAYDNSTNVNGFRLNGNLMWLDRETRASLRNTIESAALVGRTELDIWFGSVYITLPLADARMMLSVLEMYATDCYNVTSQHIVTVQSMDDIDDIISFDVTSGYPEMPEFNM